MTLVVSGGLCLTLLGCSPVAGPVEGDHGNMSIIDEWIKAISAEDVTQFEKLRTETAVFNSHVQRSPASGRQHIWDAFSHSDAHPMQKMYKLGQEDFVCLQLTAADSNRSFLHVFRLEGDLIAQVHEYSAAYDLSDVPLYDGANIASDDADLPDRIDTVDSQLDALNERDYSRFIATFNNDAIHYGAEDRIPVQGTEGIMNDLQGFLRHFPTAELFKYQTFGRGNLVCQQVAV